MKYLKNIILAANLMFISMSANAGNIAIEMEKKCTELTQIAQSPREFNKFDYDLCHFSGYAFEIDAIKRGIDPSQLSPFSKTIISQSNILLLLNETVSKHPALAYKSKSEQVAMLLADLWTILSNQ